MTTPLTMPSLASKPSVRLNTAPRDATKTMALSPSLSQVSLSPSSSPPLAVAVTLRRGTLVVVASLVLTTLVLLTAAMQHGYSLTTFDKAQTPAKEIEATIDAYNSYSGTVSSAVQRPLELFLAAIIQVVVLRFLAPLVLRPSPSFMVTLAVMVLSGLLGFLLNNSLAALNVQQRDQPITPVILASDLARNASDLLASRNVTSFNETVAENTPANAITNTVLRGLLLPREVDRHEYWSETMTGTFEAMRDSIDYGLFQRDWMKDMLTDAPVAETFTLVLNASRKSSLEIPPQHPDELPMDVSLAADLFLTGVIWSRAYIPWGIDGRELPQPNGKQYDQPAAIVAGLLPPDNTPASKSEREKRAWFVNETATFFKRWPLLSQNISSRDVVLTFSHVQLAEHIAFDAITIEVDVASVAFPVDAVDTNNQTWLGCIYDKEPWDRPSQIHAFSWCRRAADGSERLYTNANGTSSESHVACDEASNTSMLLVGAGKRLSADGLTLRPGSGNVTNLRKTYAVTFGRLSWSYVSLTETYNARCRANTETDCSAVEFKLPGDTKRLVAGPAALPLTRLWPMNFTYVSSKTPTELQLVRVIEQDRGSLLSLGDILLPHNTRGGQSFPDLVAQGPCSTPDHLMRLRHVLNNHMYIEHPLQATYTAGMYLLFQDAVTRDMIQLSRTARTLAFDGNVQHVDVRLSIPATSAWITYVGCIVLAGVLVLALVWPLAWYQTGDNPLATITDPSSIARVLLDDTMFPPRALHRRVVTAGKGGKRSNGDGDGHDAEHFEIESLTLRRCRNEDNADDDDHVAASA